MTTNELILVKFSSHHDCYFLDNNYNKINQMYYDVLSNGSSVILFFLLKAQCLLNHYLNISKISKQWPFYNINGKVQNKNVLNISTMTKFIKFK